jgi:hypothetical protein
MNFKRLLIIYSALLYYNSFSQVWPKIFGDNIRAYSRDLIENYDFGYFISGSILRDASHFKYGWLIKKDINGNLQWNKKFGDGTYENFFLILIRQQIRHW